MSETYRRRLVDPLLDDLLAELPAVLLAGARASGKTTTAERRANSIIRLDIPAEAAAFRADPDGFLRDVPAPVLIDEWQAAPESFGAVKRAVDTNPAPGRFLLTGSAYGDIEGATAAGTGRIVRVLLPGMTERELNGDVAAPSLIDQLADGGFQKLGSSDLDIRDYVRSALHSGFPEAVSVESERARARWLEGYVAQITTRDATGTVGLRDPARLRRYLEAYALNSAGVVDATTLYEAAGINKKTASAYERILENVFVTETVPAWTSNRLKRLVLSGKRYVADPGVMAAVLQLDEETIMRDSGLLGRIIDTFVVAQLRGELGVADTRPRMYHLRQRDGGHEVDIVLELGGRRLIGIEVKAAATVGRDDARHLAWLRDQTADRFVAGVVFHTGPRAFPLGDRIAALPISAIWER